MIRGVSRSSLAKVFVIFFEHSRSPDLRKELP